MAIRTTASSSVACRPHSFSVEATWNSPMITVGPKYCGVPPLLFQGSLPRHLRKACVEFGNCAAKKVPRVRIPLVSLAASLGCRWRGPTVEDALFIGGWGPTASTLPCIGGHARQEDVGGSKSQAGRGKARLVSRGGHNRRGTMAWGRWSLEIAASARPVGLEGGGGGGGRPHCALDWERRGAQSGGTPH